MYLSVADVSSLRQSQGQFSFTCRILNILVMVQPYRQLIVSVARPGIDCDGLPLLCDTVIGPAERKQQSPPGDQNFSALRRSSGREIGRLPVEFQRFGLMSQ